MKTLGAHGLTKAFEGVVVLDDVDVEFHGGRVHAVVGENGAGKSTLLKLLAGAHTPDGGSISIDGTPVQLRNPRAALAHGICRVAQEPAMMPDLTVAENVFLGALPTGRGGSLNVDWRAAERATAEVCDRLGLAVAPRARAGRLSIAQQQLVECARAMVRDARAILFDEPTSPLTAHEVEDLFAVIRSLREAGHVVVFVSHRLDEVFELADWITVLRDGRLVETRASSTTDRDGVIEAMIGRPLKAHRRARRTRGPAEAALAVRGLTSRPHFEDVSFELRRGEVLGLAGLVGSGRTEIAETIVGLRQRDAGRIELEGRDVTGIDVRAAVRRGLVYVPEDRARHSLFQQMSVMHNVSAGDLGLIRRARTPFISGRREARNLTTAAERMALKAPGAQAPIKALSGGNQQKAILGRWLLTAPRVAILDEPTRGIDAGTKEELYTHLLELAELGLSILAISSELEELVRLCDRVLAVYEGRIVAELAGAALTMDAIGRSILEQDGDVPAAALRVAAP